MKEQEIARNRRKVREVREKIFCLGVEKTRENQYRVMRTLTRSLIGPFGLILYLQVYSGVS